MDSGERSATDSLLGTCPLPQSRYEHILLGHGSGGKLTSDLIQRLFVPGFGDDTLAALEDQATVDLGVKGGNGRQAPRVAFTTDAFVVRPLFFPGGDIGRLAVHGTVNDLAVGGAQPLFLSAAFILEEGLPLADLQRIVVSMRRACDEAGVALVTGDTKVVDRGKGDGVLHHDLGDRPGAGGPLRCPSTTPGRVTGFSFRGHSATTASPSCRCARGWNSRRCWKATQHR